MVREPEVCWGFIFSILTQGLGEEWENNNNNNKIVLYNIIIRRMKKIMMNHSNNTMCTFKKKTHISKHHNHQSPIPINFTIILMMSPFFCAAPPCAKYSSRRPVAPPQHVFVREIVSHLPYWSMKNFPAPITLRIQQSYIIIELVISYKLYLPNSIYIVFTFANPLIQVPCLSWGLGYSSMLSVQWCTLPILCGIVNLHPVAATFLPWPQN